MLSQNIGAILQARGESRRKAALRADMNVKSFNNYTHAEHCNPVLTQIPLLAKGVNLPVFALFLDFPEKLIHAHGDSSKELQEMISLFMSLPPEGQRQVIEFTRMWLSVRNS